MTSTTSTNTQQTPEWFVSVPFTVLQDQDRELLERPDVTGVVLYGQNIGSMATTQALIEEIKGIKKDVKVGIDEEGGVVSRLYHLTESLSQPYIATLTPKEAKEYYKRRATFMRTIGIDINFAPVVDLAPDEDSVMYKRSFGAVPEVVVEYGRVCIEAQKAMGVESCLKHFPGLGGSSTDSHEELPEIDTSYTDWRESDRVIYAELLKSNPEYIMVGHVRYPHIDTAPASSSQRWMHELEVLGWQGRTMIDEVGMKGFDPHASAEHLYSIGIDIALIKEQNHPYLRQATT